MSPQTCGLCVGLTVLAERERSLRRVANRETLELDLDRSLLERAGGDSGPPASVPHFQGEPLSSLGFQRHEESLAGEEDPRLVECPLPILLHVAMLLPTEFLCVAHLAEVSVQSMRDSVRCAAPH